MIEIHFPSSASGIPQPASVPPETEPARRSGLEKRELLNVRQIIRPDNDIKIYHKNASAI